MHSPAATIKDIVFDSISGSVKYTSKLWAKQAAPFTNIVFRNVDIPTDIECVNAQVKIDGGLLTKKKLSSKELKQRVENIESNKKLLH